MRVLFLGDGVWATKSLLRLTQERHAVAGMVVRGAPSDPALLETARHLGIPLFQPENVNAPSFVEQCRLLRPELTLCVSYDQRLQKPILDLAPLGAINFHAGRLPFYRGRNVINWAIINGEKEIGLTAHYMDESFDTGDIILQRVLPVAWTDYYGDVLNKAVDAFPDLVAESVRLVAEKKVPRQHQACVVGTYFPKRRPGDEWLDWSDTSRNLYNKIRAISRPGPGARTWLNDREVVLWRAHYDLGWPSYIATPGEVVGERPGEGVLVKTGDSMLLVQEVQVDGESGQTPAWPIGTRLGLDSLSRMRTLEERILTIEKFLKDLPWQKET